MHLCILLSSLLIVANGFQMPNTNKKITSILTTKLHTQNNPPRRHCSAYGNSCNGMITSHPSNSIDTYSLTSKLTMVNADSDQDPEASHTSLSTPLDRPLLAAIDFAALILFAGLGKASHSADGTLDIQGVMTTAFPFLLSWFATSPFTGIYADNNIGSGIVDAGKVAAKGWIVAIPLGCALRGVIRGYVPPTSFVIVTLIVTLIILGGSRMIFSVVTDKLSGSE